MAHFLFWVYTHGAVPEDRNGDVVRVDWQVAIDFFDGIKGW